MSKPLVTIITPVYNCERYIEETIKSVLNQDYDNIQYIILDDGSVDMTPEILAKYQGLKNVVVSRHDNMGEAKTDNRGFGMAKGELIAVVNADDPLLPNCVSAMVRFADNNPDILVFYPDWDMIDENGKLIRTFTTFPYSYKWMIEQHYCIPGPGAFMRRNAIDLAGMRPEKYRYMSDFAHFMQIGLYGEFMRVPFLLATFRRTPQQQSQAKASLIVKDHIKSYEDYFNQPNIPRNISRVKSMSSAYFIAGEVAAISGDRVKAAELTAWASLMYPPNFVTRIGPSIYWAGREWLIGKPIQWFHSRDSVIRGPV